MASLPPTLIPSEKRKLVTAFRECLEVPEMNSVNMEKLLPVDPSKIQEKLFQLSVQAKTSFMAIIGSIF